MAGGGRRSGARGLSLSPMQTQRVGKYECVDRYFRAGWGGGTHMVAACCNSARAGVGGGGGSGKVPTVCFRFRQLSLLSSAARMIDEEPMRF